MGLTDLCKHPGIGFETGSKKLSNAIHRLEFDP